MENFRENRPWGEKYGWMGWLYTIVGAFIIALLVLMFLDMSNIEHFDRGNPEAAPALQIDQAAISNY